MAIEKSVSDETSSTASQSVTREAAPAGPEPTSEHAHPRRSAWVITASAMAITLIATLIISSSSRANYQQNEQRLTNLQTRLSGQLLASATLQITGQLDRVAGLSAESSNPAATFETAMGPLLKRGAQFTAASLILVAQSPTVLQRLGAAPIASPTSKTAFALYERSAHTSSLVVTRAVSGRLQRFGYLVSARGAAGTYVVAASTQLPTSRHVTLPANSPDSVLNFALYYGTKPTKSALIETNAAHLPIGGTVASEVVSFGTAHLTLVASPRTSLAGAWSERLPWAILGLGILLTIAVGVFVRRLALRRSDAEMLAVASQRLYDEQRQVSEELQLALLPKSLPSFAGVDLSARYLPATVGLEVGGDWYSVIGTDADRFAFVVGDVSGHGLSAASAMAPLRFTVRTLAKLGLSPAAILEHADTEIDIESDNHFATVLVGVVDLRDNICTLASAGHPLPLVLSDGRYEQVEIPVGPPLGLHLAPYSEHRVALPSEATLVAFTDGLVERRDESIQARIDRLGLLLASPTAPTADVAVDRLLGTIPADGHEDDIAVIVIRMSNEGALAAGAAHELTDADSGETQPLATT